MKRLVATAIVVMLVFVSAIALMPKIVMAQPMNYTTTVTGVVKDANGVVYPNSPSGSIVITTKDESNNTQTYSTQTNETGVFTVSDVIYTEEIDGGGIVDPITNEVVDMYIDFDDGMGITGHNNTKNAVPDGITEMDIITDQLIPEFSTAVMPILAMLSIFGAIFVGRRRR